jgi:hypothetical protein
MTKIEVDRERDCIYIIMKRLLSDLEAKFAAVHEECRKRVERKGYCTGNNKQIYEDSKQLIHL